MQHCCKHFAFAFGHGDDQYGKCANFNKQLYHATNSRFVGAGRLCTVRDHRRGEKRIFVFTDGGVLFNSSDFDRITVYGWPARQGIIKYCSNSLWLSGRNSDFDYEKRQKKEENKKSLSLK